MLVIDLGGGPDGEFIGGRYWRVPGPMAQFLWEPAADGSPTGGISGSWGRFLGFWNVLVSASFAFSGTELIGMAVGEVANPRKGEWRAMRRAACPHADTVLDPQLCRAPSAASPSASSCSTSSPCCSCVASPFPSCRTC